jgi:hypothetical protein
LRQVEEGVFLALNLAFGCWQFTTQELEKSAFTATVFPFYLDVFVLRKTKAEIPEQRIPVRIRKA